MKEKPMTFSAPMLRAILDGRKTQTRRVVKALRPGEHPEGAPGIKPRYPVGTRVWVRETFWMPRRDARIWLGITDVRVERLQDISTADILSEGVPADHYDAEMNIVCPFQELWESINGKGSWEANPWVWVYTFKRVKGGEA